MLDTGFDPTDAAGLKVQNFYFGEDPARVETMRKKTSEKLTGFLSKDTADLIKQIIVNHKKQASDYVFVSKYSPTSAKQLRDRYNQALCKAGFGELVTAPSGKVYAKIQRIEGHSYGKYHLKVYKKRWFTLAVNNGIPEYVAQGMLGRKRYLEQYDRTPLAQKQEFAKKILKIISVNADKQDRQETVKQMAQLLGLEANSLDDAKIATMQGLLSKIGAFMRLPTAELETVSKILDGGH